MSENDRRDEAIRQVKLTMVAFGIADTEGKISEAIVGDLDWYLRHGEVG